MPLVIHESEVDELLTMTDALGLVEQVFSYPRTKRASNQPRRRVGSGSGTLNVMFSAIPERDVCGLKSYPVSRGGVNFTVLLYRASTSELLAVIEAGRLGQLRTGAATGVATKYLASPTAESLGMFGAGQQAETQLEGVACVRKLSIARVYSRNRERLRAFCETMSDKLGLAVEPLDDPAAALDCDIVTTATSSTSPVFSGENLRSRCHINAVGSNFVSKAEIDLRTVSRTSLVVVDSIESARIEGGDLLPAIDRGVLAWERVVELSDVVSGEYSLDSAEHGITLFKSHGVAGEDIILADEVYKRAVKQGMGTRIEMFGFS